jgi:hypothetical protein
MSELTVGSVALLEKRGGWGAPAGLDGGVHHWWTSGRAPRPTQPRCHRAAPRRCGYGPMSVPTPGTSTRTPLRQRGCSARRGSNGTRRPTRCLLRRARSCLEQADGPPGGSLKQQWAYPGTRCCCRPEGGVRFGPVARSQGTRTGRLAAPGPARFGRPVRFVAPVVSAVIQAERPVVVGERAAGVVRCTDRHADGARAAPAVAGYSMTRPETTTAARALDVRGRARGAARHAER